MIKKIVQSFAGRGMALGIGVALLGALTLNANAGGTCCRGTGTPGYWLNHPEAWPVCEITIGCVTNSQEEALCLIAAPVAGNKVLTMYPALVAAKLNVLCGNESCCIEKTIEEADCWMCIFGDCKVKGNSQAWKWGERLYWKLDAYNNGLLCAPSRD